MRLTPDKSRNRTCPVLELHMYDKGVYQDLKSGPAGKYLIPAINLREVGLRAYFVDNFLIPAEERFR
jgi:hypothetical protein